MSNIIISISRAGLTDIAYYSFFAIGFIATYVFLFWYGKKISLKPIEVFISVALGSAMVLGVMGLLQKALSPLEEIVPIMNSYLNNMGRGFVFVPPIALVVSAMLKIPWVKTSNLFSFTQTIIWGFASLGCLFPGCCRGYPWKWGIYNVLTGTRVFPTQIVNSLALLSIAAYIYARGKKRKFEPDGKEYPIMLILVGITRFSTEFLMDNAKIIFGLSSLSFDALTMCLIGAVLFICIDRKRKKMGK